MSFFHQNRTTNRSDWLFILPSVLLISLFGLPLLALILRASGPDFFSFAFSSQALTALRLSLVTSSLSVLVSVALGLPLAYILARWKIRSKTAIELLIDLPIVLPPSVAGLALLIAFGRSSLIGNVLALLGIGLPYTPAAVILAQTFVSAPLFIRSARVGFSKIDPRLEEAAWVEGGNEWQVFRFVMLPLAWQAMLTGIILAWARAIGEFGATILFAGNLVGKTQTMPLAIFLGMERGLGVALALSVVLVVVSIILLGAIRRVEKKNGLDVAGEDY